MKINEITKTEFHDKLAGLNSEVRDSWVDFANREFDHAGIDIEVGKEFGNLMLACGFVEEPSGTMDRYPVWGWAKVFADYDIESGQIYEWDEVIEYYFKVMKKDPKITFQQLRIAMTDFMGN